MTAVWSAIHRQVQGCPGRDSRRNAEDEGVGLGTKFGTNLKKINVISLMFADQENTP